MDQWSSPRRSTWPRGHRASLGATTYEITRLQIDALPFQHPPDSTRCFCAPRGRAGFVRPAAPARRHANLQYRINDVLLPEGIAGFGRNSTPGSSRARSADRRPAAQYGYRTAGSSTSTPKTSANPGGDVALTAGSFGTFRAGAEASGTTATSAPMARSATRPTTSASRIRPVPAPPSTTGPVSSSSSAMSPTSSTPPVASIS